ncbi:MAG TPA: cytochrome c [Acidimicrobiia bacterium]|nr:cytochrome c [Acidimicrobiia bacterium]
MNVRTVLIVLNFAVLIGLAIYVARSVGKSREPKEPENLTPFLDDESLEGRRLDRVLGWALLFAAVIAIALPMYWLREPSRQEESIGYFDDGAVERGAVLYANSASEGFNSAVSLQCANCHGVDGGGGSANSVYTPPGGDDSDAIQLTWRAPALNTVLLRFSEEEVRNILVYGRPGTPMQAWGVAGGGPKNDQSIDDLIEYIRSIQLSPEKAKAAAEDALVAARKAARQQVADAEKAVTDAEQALADAEAALDGLDADATDADRAEAERKVDDAEEALADAEEALEWAQEWAAARTDVSDGQLLFESYCARCHTKGWSLFDAADPTSAQVLGLPGGGGTVGFNLRDGASQRRFGEGTEGFDEQLAFVTEGSEANKPYGNGGIGNGRMPGFGAMLPEEYIRMIVEYERNEGSGIGLDDTTYPGLNGTED